jgi:hypothetical protein
MQCGFRDDRRDGIGRVDIRVEWAPAAGHAGQMVALQLARVLMDTAPTAVGGGADASVRRRRRGLHLSRAGTDAES